MAYKRTDAISEAKPRVIIFFSPNFAIKAPKNTFTIEVEIYLKFIGEFEIPQRELTEEELEQKRIKKYWQDRYWKRRDYELNRRKKQKEKEATLTAELY